VHDLSDGGLAVAVAEMALAGGLGAQIDAAADQPAHAWFFGEDQARYVITAPAAALDAILAEAKAAAVPAMKIGVVGGQGLQLGHEAAINLDEVRHAHEDWLPSYMSQHKG
jgi:phosphoribosylformylglycinamidine synthase